MRSVTIAVPTRRYEVLVTVVANLLGEYGIAEPPSEGFDVETLEGVGEFERFEIVRDLAVRLGDARHVAETRPEAGDDESAVSVEIHAHHLVGLVAALPDLAGATDVSESEVSVVVQGLCHAYLAERAAASRGEG